MLTRRGWALVVGAVLFAGAGRLFGILELYVLAAAAAGLAVLAVGYVWVRGVRVDVHRTLHPPRVHAGASSRVDLELRNVGRWTTPVIEVRDPFQGGRRWARFLAAPLRPGEGRRAAYRLPTERRGIFDIGPLEIGVSDPFALASTTFEALGVTQLTVYPPVDVIVALPQVQGHDPQSGSDRPTARVGPGDDFYALRQYQRGDDTRRVHWPSTARLDELMIRQDELPWQHRATVLLDVREGMHTERSLDLAVSAAASIHRACRQAGSLVRLVTTDGTDSGFAGGHGQAVAILEHLATVQPSGTGSLAPLLTTLRRGTPGGALAVITSDRASGQDLSAFARLRGRHGLLVLVRFERSSYDGSPAPLGQRPAAPPPGVRLVRVTGEQPFAAAWDSAVAMAAARR